MSPYDHSRLSVKRFEGRIVDYIEIHRFLDSTKFHFPTYLHRAVLHNSFGMELCEKLFGDVITLENGKTIAVREIARRHILEDCNQIPTLKESIVALIEGNYGELYNKPRKEDLQWLKEN